MSEVVLYSRSVVVEVETLLGLSPRTPEYELWRRETLGLHPPSELWSSISGRSRRLTLGTEIFFIYLLTSTILCSTEYDERGSTGVPTDLDSDGNHFGVDVRPSRGDPRGNLLFGPCTPTRVR